MILFFLFLALSCCCALFPFCVCSDDDYTSDDAPLLQLAVQSFSSRGAEFPYDPTKHKQRGVITYMCTSDPEDIQQLKESLRAIDSSFTVRRRDTYADRDNRTSKMLEMTKTDQVLRERLTHASCMLSDCFCASCELLCFYLFLFISLSYLVRL